MNFVVEHPFLLEPEVCLDIIRRFEEDPRKAPGMTSLGYEPGFKQTTEIPITETPGWEDIDKLLFEKVRHFVVAPYLEQFPILKTLNVGDKGFHLKRYRPGEEFKWHFDNKVSRDRLFIVLIYLNTIMEGGETAFAFYPNAIRPLEGKGVIFPAGWTHTHCGKPPIRENKYVITSWLSMR